MELQLFSIIALDESKTTFHLKIFTYFPNMIILRIFIVNMVKKKLMKNFIKCELPVKNALLLIDIQEKIINPIKNKD